MYLTRLRVCARACVCVQYCIVDQLWQVNINEKTESIGGRKGHFFSSYFSNDLAACLVGEVILELPWRDVGSRN